MRKSVHLGKLAKRLRRGEAAPHRAWADTRSWLLSHILAWFLAFIVPGGGTVLATVLAPTNISSGIVALYGFIGGLLGLVVLGLGVYIVQLGLAPYRQRDEARQQLRELRQSLRDSSQRSIRNDISLVYDPFFSICVERFQDGTEIHRIGILNESNQTVNAEVTVGGSWNLQPELSVLPLRPTHGAIGSSSRFDVDPSSEFHLGSSVDFVKWNPRDRTMQICYFNHPYPEKNCVYRLVRGHKYSVSLCISVKDARIETEWQVKMYVNGRRLNIGLSEVEVWGDL